ncbi:MAG TPA: ATP-dependent protease ATPase subunit HslU [Chloroflexota bacterium]|jgi:ATP-dependent HslUV protease ATP-binding subunit HslU|nr:ATP-dependent protease ATPase subunit HslU [Chloroflexota bacterium]
MDGLTPQRIVQELDRYIVGQSEAKRGIAIAVRNRYRRQQLDQPMRDEVTPKNVLMIGPTGVGKTEIARRIAKLIDAPFIKVEATKFTEVGYVGRDVESIIRDLIEATVNNVQEQRQRDVRERAERLATERLITYLCPSASAKDAKEASAAATEANRLKRRRKRVAEQLAAQKIEEQVVEIEVEAEEPFAPVIEIDGGMSAEDMQETFHEFVASVATNRRRMRSVPVREARKILIEQEAEKLIDWEQVVDGARERVEQSGIVFIDEIDKVANGRSELHGADISREGVQRDLLPIVEGSTVQTRYGPVKTDHILFVAAGAFHHSKPSDLLPELQGRFPLRVELQSLTPAEFERILREPENSLPRQYTALLETEDVHLEFTDDGISELAHSAVAMNDRLENIGARRLTTVVEKVLDQVSFEAPERAGETLAIDAAYVKSRLGKLLESEDLAKYIL